MIKEKGSLDRTIEPIKMNQINISELKIKMQNMKNLLDQHKNKFKTTKGKKSK